MPRVVGEYDGKLEVRAPPKFAGEFRLGSGTAVHKESVRRVVVV
jgi:hypothetical protein